MKAAIYDRGSTIGQTDNYSRANAKREGIRIAEANGFEWEYHKEIKSGASLSRREVLLSILDRVAAGEIHAIIVQDLDRLARPDEAADFETIKNICFQADVKVYTQSTVYDWASPDDVMMGRFKSAIAGRERDYITERSIRGKKEKAREGGFMGGLPALGYRVHYELNDRGERLSRLVIDHSERQTVTVLFDLYIKHGAYGCAKRLTELGYKGKTGSNFIPRTVYDVIRNPIYAGYATWGQKSKTSKWLRDYEPEWVFRPELQIVSLDTWEQAQEVKKKRGLPYRNDGSWGTSPFTGFLACEACGAAMTIRQATSNGKKVKLYRCNARSTSGRAACPDGKSHTLKLVAKGVIPLIAELLTQDLSLEDMLQDAVDKYGHTVSEAELRAQLEAELFTTKERQRRLVDSISQDVITADEAKETMQDLRDKTARIERQLDNLSGKVKAREEYLRAVEVLKGQDIEAFLWGVMENDTAIFRQIMGLIFKPHSIKVETYRVKAREFDCRILAYEFTEDFGNLQSLRDAFTSPQKIMARPWARNCSHLLRKAA